MTKKQLEAMSAKARAGRQKNKIDGWITSSAKTVDKANDDIADEPNGLSGQLKSSKSANNKRKASTLVVEDFVIEDGSAASQKRPRTGDEDDVLMLNENFMVQCPICDQKLAESEINDHLDVVHVS